MTHDELMAKLREEVDGWIMQTQLDASYTSDYAEFTIGAFRRVLALLEKELG